MDKLILVQPQCASLVRFPPIGAVVCGAVVATIATFVEGS